MILLKKMVVPAVLCLTFSAATVLHAQDRMRTGMWESTVTSASGQSATRSHCFKPEDAAKSNGSSAEVRAATEKEMSKSACTLKDFILSGNTLSLTMICAGTITHQEAKFHGGDSFETTTTNTVNGVTKVTQIKSRRIGDCKAGAESGGCPDAILLVAPESTARLHSSSVCATKPDRVKGIERSAHSLNTRQSMQVKPLPNRSQLITRNLVS